MSIVLALCSVLLIVLVLLDGFEAMLLPRRVTRAFRFARLFYRYTWMPWSAIGRRMPPGRRRENFLSLYGPMSILVLFMAWAVGPDHRLRRAAPGARHAAEHARAASATRIDYLYMSGTTFFTLGFGDVTPADPLGRMLAVAEAGIGFAFLAVDHRLPAGALRRVLAARDRRSRCSTPAPARRRRRPRGCSASRRPASSTRSTRLLEEWERWAAEVLESHLSFPVLPLLPVAARQPVVARRADDHARRLRPEHVGGRGGRPHTRRG